MTDPENTPLLQGLRVIELANVLAGPATGMFLAELGAEVIKVEHPAGGDPTRGWTASGEQAGDGISGYFASTNWGKSSIAVDLMRPEGQALVQDLCAGADLVLQSFKPGDDARFGVDYATLRARRPDVIYGCISAYGLDDPRPGFDAVIQAEAGFTFLNGEPGGMPVKMPVALMDLLAAHQLKEGLLLALLRRERTGEGAFVHVSLIRAAVAALANQATNWLVAGRVPQRLGSAHPNVAPYGTLYRTADEVWFVLAVGTDRQFANLVAALERTELATDERYATNAARVRHSAELDALLAEAFAALDSAELGERLRGARVPFGHVNTMPDVFEQPQAAELVLSGRRPGGDSVRAVRTAAFDGDLPWRPPSAPPALGADAERILAEVVGYDRQRRQALYQSGVVAPPRPSQPTE